LRSVICGDKDDKIVPLSQGMLIIMVHHRELLWFGSQERSFSEANVAIHGTSNASILKLSYYSE
jgi:hypothetical protein